MLGDYWFERLVNWVVLLLVAGVGSGLVGIVWRAVLLGPGA